MDDVLWRLNISIVGVFTSFLVLGNIPSVSELDRLPVFSIDRNLGIYASFLLLTMALVGVVRGHNLTSDHISRHIRPKVAGVLATLIIFFSVASRQPFRDYPGLWAGFGFQSAAVSLALAATILIQPFDRSTIYDSKKIRFFLLSILPLAIISPRLLLFIQPPNGLINLGDTSYHVIDELLAPLAGSIPYSDYSPQYAGALGWWFYPVKFLGLSGNAMMLMVIIVCNVLNLLVPILVIAVAQKVHGRMNRPLALSAFIGLWTVCGSDLGYSAQVREFSHFARFVPALLALWLVLRAVDPVDNGPHRIATLLAGSAVGFSCLNSADHGLTFTAALVLALLVEIRSKRVSLPQALNMFLGFSATIGGYLLILLVSEAGPSVGSYVGLRESALGGSVYGGQIAPAALGPHLLVLVVPVLLFVLPVPRVVPFEESRSQEPAIFVGNVVGLWILLLAAKFFLFPIAPASAALVVPAFLGGVSILARIRLDSILGGSWWKKLQFAPTMLLLCTALGSVLPTSNVNLVDELNRISGRFVNSNNWSTTPGRPVDGYSLTALRKEDDFLNVLPALKLRSDFRDGSIGYFGVFGNTVEMVLNIDNVLGIAAPESMRFGAGQEKLACVPVTVRQPEVILVYAARFPCDGYMINEALSDETFFVYERVQASEATTNQTLPPMP